MFQKTYTVDYLTKKRVENTGELPSYYCENTHPKIIDRDIWECVQLEFHRRDRFSKERKVIKFYGENEKLMFSARMFCRVCGNNLMRRKSKRKEDMGEYYWGCKKYRMGRYKEIGPDDCNNGIRIKEALLEEVFVRAWNQLVEDRGWENEVKPKDVLEKYRVAELIKLTNEIGKIEKLTYELVLKTLDYIEIDNDGKIEIVFLAGIKI